MKDIVASHVGKPRFTTNQQIYIGQDIGGSLTVEAFNEWYAKQDTDTQVIIVEVCDNKQSDNTAGKNVLFKVENYADKNSEDLLKEYDEVLRKEERNDRGKENSN